MNIWVKTRLGVLINLSNVVGIHMDFYEDYQENKNWYINFLGKDNFSIKAHYDSESRCQEVIQLIQDHINAIGTNNFNNLPMVYVMPIE